MCPQVSFHWHIIVIIITQLCCGTEFENGENGVSERARHSGAARVNMHVHVAHTITPENEEQLFNGRKLTFTLFPDAHYHYTDCRQLISKL